MEWFYLLIASLLPCCKKIVNFVQKLCKTKVSHKILIEMGFCRWYLRVFISLLRVRASLSDTKGTSLCEGAPKSRQMHLYSLNSAAMHYSEMKIPRKSSKFIETCWFFQLDSYIRVCSNRLWRDNWNRMRIRRDHSRCFNLTVAVWMIIWKILK